MLRFRLRMKFAPEIFDEAVAVLRSLLGPVRAEPGCAATRLLREFDGDCVVTWVEEWRSKANFELHIRAATFNRILAVMELAVMAPEVEIDDVASRRGFDLVEEMLSRGRPQAQADA